MNKVQIEAAPDAYKLLNPGSVVLISVGDGTADNLFAVTWNMPLRRDPGMVAILSGKRHFSYPFIESSGEFGVNVPHAGIAAAVLGCGRVSGSSEPDKFGRFGLTRQAAAAIRAPLVAEAIGSLECRVSRIVDLGQSALVLGEIVAAWADPDHFSGGEWCFDNGLQLLHHLGADRFAVTERELAVERP